MYLINFGLLREVFKEKKRKESTHDLDRVSVCHRFYRRGTSVFNHGNVVKDKAIDFGLTLFFVSILFIIAPFAFVDLHWKKIAKSFLLLWGLFLSYYAFMLIKFFGSL